MAPASRHFQWARLVTGVGLTVTAALTGFLVHAWRQMPPTLPDLQPAVAVPTFGSASRVVLSNDVWSVMSGGLTSAPPLVSGSRNLRFRLAGTFFVDSSEGQVQRKAILDDLARHEQSIVGEGDTVSESRVERIYYDHVTIRSGAVTEDVWLDFGRGYGLAGGAMTTNAAVATNEVAAATNSLGGIQLQPDRWQFSRQRLLDYYQEVLEEPDRMVAIFDSLKPVRGQDSKITGYVVGVEGEGQFFQAVGLVNGDIVRSVNSIPMTNRRRAEFLIDEFLKDRMNVVILDVERGGQTTKQVYMVRP